jgi:hypothetical protein
MNTAPKRLPKTIPIVTAAALTLGLVAAGMASGVGVGRTFFNHTSLWANQIRPQFCIDLQG